MISSKFDGLLPRKRLLKWIWVVALFMAFYMAFQSLFPEFTALKTDTLHSHFPVNSKESRRLQSIQNSKEKSVTHLENQIKELQDILLRKQEQLLNSKKDNADEGDLNLLEKYPEKDTNKYLKDQFENADILHGVSGRNEYFVHHFTMFDRNDVYQLCDGLRRKPEDLISSTKDLAQELGEVIENGVIDLNAGSKRLEVTPTYRFTSRDFLHGIYRTERGKGTQYILNYQPSSSKNLPNDPELFQVTIFRPFAQPRIVSSRTVKSKETIHFIVPLQGRSDTFRIFVEYYKDFAIHDDGNVHLTVVYYGREAYEEVESILNALKSEESSAKFNLVNIIGEEFSRGRALQRGADSLKGAGNPLLFFCDVDIAFTSLFLDQCRSHTQKDTSVFYPIVFSLYNPVIVYNEVSIPSFRDRQVIKKNNGMWRDFGFGMTCQYYSDFKSIGGFDLSITGWGVEDKLLYRKHVQSQMLVVRTPVNSLFHQWHSKSCDVNWSKEQYESCLRSRGLTEASHKDLGLLYFELQHKLQNSEET